MKTLRSLLVLASLLFTVATAADAPFEAAYRASLLKSFEESTGKLLSLAEAIPEANYGWQPMEGVSTVGDILVHVTETHYALAERLGTKPPSGIDRKKMSAAMRTKAEAIAATKRSVEFMAGVLAAIPADSLLPEVNVFGAKVPKLRVTLLPLDHAHEHLGQLIAYARMNRVVPPWSK
ncbi:MAG: DinB family protein [Opitutaceae bacterium]